MSIERSGALIALGAAPEPDAYRGMSYEQASRRGQLLCEVAGLHGLWKNLPEHLIALRLIMNMQPSAPHA